MQQELDAGPRHSVVSFGDRVADAVERKRSQIVLGIDPRADLLPLELRAGAHASRAAAAEACAASPADSSTRPRRTSWA